MTCNYFRATQMAGMHHSACNKWSVTDRFNYNNYGSLIHCVCIELAAHFGTKEMTNKSINTVSCQAQGKSIMEKQVKQFKLSCNGSPFMKL